MSSGAINSSGIKAANNLGSKPFVGEEKEASAGASNSANKARGLAAGLRDGRGVTNKSDLVSGKADNSIKDHEVYAEIEDFIKTSKGGDA